MNEADIRELELLERRITKIEKLLGIYIGPLAPPCVLAYKFCGHEKCRPEEKKK